METEIRSALRELADAIRTTINVMPYPALTEALFNADATLAKEAATPPLSAALPHLGAAGVAVRELEWSTPARITDTLIRAETPLGIYRVWTFPEAGGRWFWSLDGYTRTTGEAGTKPAAKAAAQADFDQCIRSALVPSPVPQEALPLDRDTLGRMVREAWVRWAMTQPSPKPSWLLPYDELAEPDKEADRQIGEAIAKWTVIHYEARAALAPVPQEATAEPVACLISYIDAIDALPGAAANFPDDRFVAHGDRVGGFTFGDLRRLRASPPSHDAELLAAREALRAVLGWIDNWDPNFIWDDEWPATRKAADAALAPAASQEGR